MNTNTIKATWMIYINHEKKAVFLHIPKTGGSYIGPTLVKYYGFTSFLDLIAYRRPDHDTICRTAYLPQVKTGNILYDYCLFNKIIGLMVYCSTSEYFNHKMNMTEEKWKTYTKFCFVRNPYARLVSGWKHFNTVFHRSVSLLDYVKISNPMHSTTDIEYGHVFMSQKRQMQDILGQCGVDIIGRFEHLEEDLCAVLRCLGFTTIHHPVKRVNVSNDSGSHELILDSAVIRFINRLFVDDFETFHYQMVSI